MSFIHDGKFYDYCDLAVEYIEKHNIEKVDECIEKAAQLTDRVGVAGERPNCASVFFEIANIYSDKKNFGKAIEYYELARREYVCYSEGYYYANRLEHLDNAIKCCIYILFIDPGNAEAYRNKGLAYYLKEDYDKAIESWEKAIALDRYFAEAYYYIGKAYEAIGNKDKAQEYKLKTERAELMQLAHNLIH